jgi:hypothetical protein
VNSGVREWRCITGSSDGRVLYASTTVVEETGGIFKSIDYGETWLRIRLSNTYSDMVCTSDGSTLFVSLGSYVLKMVGLSETLYQVGGGGLNINSLSISSNGQIIVVAPSGSTLWRSINGGTTWSAMANTESANWFRAAISSDGTYITAVLQDLTEQTYHIKRSGNSGTTWTNIVLPDTQEGLNRTLWAEMSADGSKQVMISNSGYIYMSTDYGLTWTSPTKLIANPSAACSSVDGTKLYYVDAASGYFYYSSDSGLSWTRGIKFAGTVRLDCSDDGSYIFAALFGTGTIYKSTNSGVSWTAVATGGSDIQWYSISVSSTGQYVAAVAFSNGIWRSSDYGATYTASYPTGQAQNWISVSMSPDGTHIAMISNNSIIFKSSNGGSSFTQVTAPSGIGLSSAIAINSDGTKLAIGTFIGTLYTSSNSGSTWTLRTNYPPAFTYNIRFTPTGDNIIVGTRINGIVKSTDLGVTWNSGGGFGQIGAIGKSTDGTVLYGTEEYGSPILSRDGGTTWTELNLPYRQRWTAIAGSSDCVKLAAVAYDGAIWTSTNLGLSWTSRSVGAYKNWRTISSSANGSVLLAGVSGEYLYTSADSGATWTARSSAGSRSWRASASSSTGAKLAAAAYGGSIWTSTDTGATWTEQTAAGSRNWSALVSSADGSTLVAAAYGGSIWTSTDSGATWTERTGAGSRNWSSLFCSSNGATIAATVAGGSIWTSTDTGANWTERTNAGSRDWASITGSSTGSFLLAAVTNGGFWMSKSTGARWTEIPESPYSDWRSIICSTDGLRVAACIYGESIFLSGDRGVTLQAVEVFGVNTSIYYWHLVRCSLDGRYVAASYMKDYTYDRGYVLLSRDFGRNFTIVRSLGMKRFTSLAVSATASTIVAAAGNDSVTDYIYTSSNRGASWTARTGPGKRLWASVACSQDGTFIIAAPTTGNIYTSSDSGANWTTRTAAGSRPWLSREGIACSATGELIYAVSNNSLPVEAPTYSVYKGWNYGANWELLSVSPPNPITSIDASPDGLRILFGTSGGGLSYYSTDEGKSFDGTLVTRTNTACAIAAYANIIAAVDNTLYRDIFYNSYQTESFALNPNGSLSMALSQDGSRMYIGNSGGGSGIYASEPPLDIGWVVAKATDTTTLAVTKGNSKPTIGTVDVEIHPSNTTRIDIYAVNDAGYSYYVSTIVN